MILDSDPSFLKKQIPIWLNPLKHERFLDQYYFKMLWGGGGPKGHPQQKGLQGQEFAGMGCVIIFWVKGKETGAESATMVFYQTNELQLQYY